MSNSTEMAVAIFAIMAAGAQVSPVNPFFKGAELQPILIDAKAKIIISDLASFDKAKSVKRPDREPQDVKLIFFNMTNLYFPL